MTQGEIINYKIMKPLKSYLGKIKKLTSDCS